MKDPQGIYLDLSADFDLVEYTNKLIETIESRVAKVERDFCIEFVRSLNTEVANALEEKRGNLWSARILLRNYLVMIGMRKTYLLS